MEIKLITRIWHGRTRREVADEYLDFLIETAFPDYSNSPGNLDVEVWRRFENDVCHFWTVTKWDSFANIEKFAGADVEKAKYYPEDSRYLLEFEENVIHCETYRL